VKKLFVLCFLFFGCSYAPHYSLVKDSYNTYAPVYSPTETNTYSPTYQTRPSSYATATPARSLKYVPTYQTRTIYRQPNSSARRYYPVIVKRRAR
jgi:hypothetical protein